MSQCAVCNAEDIDELEEVGRQAMAGDISWRKAAEVSGRTRQSLKTHMESHVLAQVEKSANDEFEAMVEQAISELAIKFASAPPELKADYLVAMHNLRGLKDTKPSQQNLIAAMRAVNEVIQMKQNTALMFQFARAAFNAAPKPAELEQPVIDVEEVE